jgi:hypothetical protein
MEDILTEYASVPDADTFWANLAALLTDEVVIIEAQAVGMDWPEFADGRRRLSATRRVIVATAATRNWITGTEADVFGGEDAQRALEAARPWIEREQQIALEDAETGFGPAG